MKRPHSAMSPRGLPVIPIPGRVDIRAPCTGPQEAEIVGPDYQASPYPASNRAVMNTVPNPNQYLRRHSPTAGKGGLPTIEPYDPQVHAALVDAGGHPVETVYYLEPGTRVTAFDNITKTMITGEIDGTLDEVRGVYPVRPETSASPILVDAWTVRPV